MTWARPLVGAGGLVFGVGSLLLLTSCTSFNAVATVQRTQMVFQLAASATVALAALMQSGLQGLSVPALTLQFIAGLLDAPTITAMLPDTPDLPSAGEPSRYDYISFRHDYSSSPEGIINLTGKCVPAANMVCLLLAIVVTTSSWQLQSALLPAMLASGLLCSLAKPSDTGSPCGMFILALGLVQFALEVAALKLQMDRLKRLKIVSPSVATFAVLRVCSGWLAAAEVSSLVALLAAPWSCGLAAAVLAMAHVVVCLRFSVVCLQLAARGPLDLELLAERLGGHEVTSIQAFG